MKILNKFLTGIYWIFFTSIPIIIWSMVILVSIIISYDAGEWCGEGNNGGFIFLFYIGIVCIMFFIQYLIKIRFGLNLSEWNEVNQIYWNKTDIILDIINKKIEFLKNISIFFTRNNELKTLFISSCNNPEKVIISGNKKKILLYSNDAAFPLNITNIPKKIVRGYDSKNLGYTIEFDDNPPLQLIELTSDIKISIYSTFSKKYKNQFKNYLIEINHKFKESTIFSNEAIKNFLKGGEIPTRGEIFITEYGLKFGSMVQKINHTDFLELINLYEKVVFNEDKRKLKLNIEKFND